MKKFRTIGGIIGGIAIIYILIFLLSLRHSRARRLAEIHAMSATQIREVFTGNWTQLDSKGSLVLHSGGSFDRRIYDRKLSQGPIPADASQWLYEGTWEVKDGVLALSISNAVARNTTNVEPIGSVEDFTVSDVNERHLLLAKDGTEINFRR